MTDWTGPVAVRRAARGTLVQSGGRIGYVALQAGLVAVLARALAPDAFAAFVAATALLGIVEVVAEFGTTTTAVVEMGKHPEQAQAIARATRRANLLMLVIGVVVSLPFLVFGYSHDARLAFVCLVPATAVNRFAAGHLALRRHRLELARLGWADLIGRSATVVIAAPLLFASWTTASALAAVGVAYAAGALLSFAVMRAPSRPDTPGEAMTGRRMLRVATPLALAGVVSFVHVRADQVLLEVLDRTEDLGAYAIAYRVLESTVGILTLAAGGMLALLARAKPEDRAWLTQRCVAVIDVLGVVAACGVLALAGPIGRILGGTQVPHTDILIALIAPLVWVSTINAVFASVSIVDGRSARLAQIAVIGTIANVAGCLAAIPAWGAQGAALVTLTTELFGLVMVALVASHVVDLHGVAVRLAGGTVGLAVVTPLWYRVWDGDGGWLLALALSVVIVALVVVRNRVELVAAGRRVAGAEPG